MEESKGRWTIRTNDWALVDNKYSREYRADTLKVAFNEDQSRACFWFNRRYLCDVPVNKKFAARVQDKIAITNTFLGSDLTLSTTDETGNLWSLQGDTIKSESSEVSLIGARFKPHNGNTLVLVYGVPTLQLIGEHCSLLTEAKMAALERLYTKLPDDTIECHSNFQRQQQLTGNQSAKQQDDNEYSMVSSVIAFIAWTLLLLTLFATMYFWPEKGTGTPVQYSVALQVLFGGVFYWAVTLGLAEVVKYAKVIAWRSKRNQ